MLPLPGGARSQDTDEETHEMTAVTRWVAAGSSATMLAGSLFLGAPPALAAPGDEACLQASGQLHTALAAVGITLESVTQFEQAAAAVAAAEAELNALVEAAAGPLLGELEVAWAALETAQASGDPAAVEAAEATVAALEAELEVLLDTPEIIAAQEALDAAFLALESLPLFSAAPDQATVDALLALFKQFLAACEEATGDTPVVAPVVQPVLAPGPEAPVVPVAPAVPVEAAPLAPAPVPVAAPAPVPAVPAAPAPVAAAAVAPAPVTAAPVAAAPAAAAGNAPVAVNPGLNLDTAVAAERTGRPGAAPAAGLLAAALLVPPAVFAWSRRAARHRR